MTYVPVKCECGCVFWSATSHCPNCNAPVKPQARPIDANVLVDRLDQLIKTYDELYNNLEVGNPSKSIMYGKYTTLVETRIDVRHMPTLDYEPVRHGEWIKQKNGKLICSVCGVRGLQDSDELDYYYYPSVYCPNCGARMDAKEDAHG